MVDEPKVVEGDDPKILPWSISRISCTRKDTGGVKDAVLRRTLEEVA
jgi:hypothetical protein